MTENQLYPMSADFFDTSSNSSALKIDLFAFGFNERSPLHQLSVSTSGSVAGVGSNSNSLSGYSPNKSAISFHHSHISPGGISSSNSSNGGLNVMLTNAITIPRSSHNPHQSHHDSYPEDAHPNPSPLLSQQMMSSHQQQLLQQQQQQQQQQLQQQLQQHQQQQQQQPHQQQQHQQEHERFMVDFSEYGLEALDPASLSPTLLHDVSFTSADSPLNNTLQSMTQGDGPLAGGGFFGQDPQSPISHSGSNSVVGSVPNDSAVGLLGLAGGVGDSEVPLLGLYEDNVNGNTMWSDIGGSGNVTTKNELDDDYIFPIDKTEIQSLSDERFIGVSFDDLLPNAADAESSSVANAVQNGFFEQFAGDSLTALMPQKLQSQLQQQQQSQQQQQQRQLQVELQQLQELHQQPPQLMQSVPLLGGPSPYEFYTSTPNKQQQQQMLAAARFSPGSQSSQSPLQLNSVTPPPPASRPPYQQQHLVKSRHMQDLKKDFSMSPDRLSAQLGQSMPNSQILLSGQALSPGSGSSGFGSATGASTSTASGSIRAYQSPEAGGGSAAVSRLSSSAPTHLGLDLWKRREPRQHLLSTGSLAEAESYSSLSTGSVLSPSCQDYSQDDEDDASSEYLSDHYDDFSSDNGSDNEDEGRTSTPSNLSSSKGKERFFWQYNVQAKGPKGKRLVFQSRLEDPHVLNEVTDPVFSPNCSVRGIKHSGKARKGDGNDLTPNPRKLHSIGRELDKLSRTINDMTPVSELPFNVRPKSRKEKNKLASRACRLKKKAQHEANKIKNFGLEIEHRRLLNGIAEIKQALLLKYQKQNSNEISAEIDQQIERSYQQATSGLQIAGASTDFVNKVLENVKAGVPHGGLDALRNA